MAISVQLGLPARLERAFQLFDIAEGVVERPIGIRVVLYTHQLPGASRCVRSAHARELGTG